MTKQVFENVNTSSGLKSCHLPHVIEEICNSLFYKNNLSLREKHFLV